MLEKPNFYEYLSAVDNLKIVAEIRGVDYSEIDSVLNQVGLLERKNSKFKTFSLGMKQRLAIGAALLGNPEVLILDEPTNGLDPEGIAEVRHLIKDLASDNKTIILASHLLDEVQKVCTKMIVLKKGVKIFQGSVNGLEKDKVIIEVMADDMELLEAVLSKSMDFQRFKRNNQIIQIEVDTNINKSALSAYLFENKVIVSHLAVKQESLEDNIFELLKETR
jgi:ABC-2 type transport system ATP-binding protein